jgi:hypothetical protein
VEPDPQPGRIDEIRAQSEALQGELELERYLSGAGLKIGSELTGIYDRYRDLESAEARASVRARLANVRDELGGAAAGLSRDALAAEERRLRYLHAELVELFVGAETKALYDDLVTREQRALLELGEGDVVPFRRAGLEMSLERGRERRARIEHAQVRVVEERLNPIHAERLGMEAGVARSMGHASFAELWQAVHGIDLRDLLRIMQGFVRATDDMYREAMGWYVRKQVGIALADARRHDMLAIFHGDRWEDMFPKSDMVRVASRFLGEMGIDLRAGGNIELDLEPRDLKRLRAFCAPIEVPGRVVIVTSPEGGRRDWRRFFHELGMALHLAYTSPEEPYEHRCLGDASLRESYAFLMQYLLTDRSWLKRYLGMRMSKVRDYLFDVYLEKLAYLRRYTARLAYELELRGDGVDADDMPERYEAHMRQALVLGYPRGLFLYDVDQTFYSARYLRAWLFEALLSKHLVHYFDEDWYRNPRCGVFLKKHWALGSRHSVEGMVEEIGYEGLTARPLEEELVRAL